MREGGGAGRAYLLTGVTGFLGKVLLEELLRRRDELETTQVTVVIRRKGARGADERFRREVAPSACFVGLPRDWTRLVRVVEGTLEHPGLALDPAARDAITGTTTHALHAAASVEFDHPLADAARWNVAASLNLLELARACAGLERLVYVSTAYVTPAAGAHTSAGETLAPLPAPAEELYGDILNGGARAAELFRRSGHPNTYTFTKSLAEHLLVARSGGVPLAIVRPSIISASWRYPFPGWIDSAAGFATFVMLLGSGHLRAVVGDPDARLDLIPVDEVATRILLACNGAPPAGSEPLIQHAVAGVARSATVRECWTRIQDFFAVHPVERPPAMRYLGPPGLAFGVADAMHHRLPIAAAGMRTPRARRAAAQLRARLTHANRVFRYFTRHTFDFRSAAPLDAGFDPGGYVATVSRGVYRYLLRRDDTQWCLAGRRHPGHGGDLRWARRQPDGTGLLRAAAWLVTKVLRRCCERITVDLPSFEAARRAVPPDCPLVIVPSHRSYLDFILCSYLFFARRDLGVPIPYVAAAVDFARIPVVGWLATRLQAFYVTRGEGREDPAVTARVRALVRERRALEVFIEGQRSRSRRFLPPKRGLLRSVQATGEPCALLPVALSYERVPEEASFARELAGAPKPKMRLGALLAWTVRVFLGRIDLGRIHIACGAPIPLDPADDVYAASQEVLARLARATVTTTYHLRGFLDRHPVPGVDAAWLRRAIEQRGGRVLESALSLPPDLDPEIARSLGNQFAHLFETGAGDEPLEQRLGALRAAPGHAVGDPGRAPEPVA